jgi:hypothetical protein
MKDQFTGTNFSSAGLALVVMVISLSGCCSSQLRAHCEKTVVDRFMPSALYQASNSNRMVLGGTIHKGVALGQAFWLESDKKRRVIPVFLILPQSEIISTNNEGWLQNLDERWPQGTPAVTRRLPANYSKIADLRNESRRTALIAGSTRSSYSGWMALAPLTLTVDIATSPIQLILLGLYVLNGPF